MATRRTVLRHAAAGLATVGVGSLVSASAGPPPALPWWEMPDVQVPDGRSTFGQAEVGLPAFRVSGYRALRVAEAYRPWRAQQVSRVDTGVHDAHGVRMFRWKGHIWNHPVGQVQYGLQNLNTYRRTGDPFFLDRARAQADRLVATRHEARGAWYFPYGFKFGIEGHPGLSMSPPWYSGMSQGEATSLFAQLAQVEALDSGTRARYADAAGAAFASLTVGTDARPWVVDPDPHGYLWLQEYPGRRPERSDFTYNGHMFGTLGLWDYATLTGSALAAKLFDGAATTIARYGARIRNPGWYSRYCLSHGRPHPRYHKVHIQLLLQLYWLTGRPEFAALADTFLTDYPPPDLTGDVVFAPGTHTLHRFDDDGAIEATKPYEVRRPTAQRTDNRVRVKGRGIFYRLVDGDAAGWYAAEDPERSYLRGEFLTHPYPEARVVRLPPGRYTGRRYDHAGAQTAAKIVTVARPSLAHADRRAVVNGRAQVRLADGALAGHWVPVAGLTLDPPS